MKTPVSEIPRMAPRKKRLVPQAARAEKVPQRDLPGKGGAVERLGAGREHEQKAAIAEGGQRGLNNWRERKLPYESVVG